MTFLSGRRHVPAHRLFLFAAFLFALVFSARLSAAESTGDVRFAFEPDGYVYSAGDEIAVSMTVTAPDGTAADAGTLYVRVTNDGGETLEWHEFSLADANPAVLRTTLPFPGHMLIRVTASGGGLPGDVNRAAGILFSPERIEPALPEPDDFDAFLAEGKALVRKVPLDPQMTPIGGLCDGDGDIEVTQVSFATLGGERVYGFLSKPAGGGPFPAIVTVPGAGPGLGPDLALPKEGFAVLLMNVFPYPVPIDPAERQRVHDEFNEKLGMRYCFVNADNRETYYYRPIFLGVDRAVDWLADQPFIDRGRIGFDGTSQGGAAALILTAMNGNIRAAVASVPALCDHAGPLKGRAPGWPLLYPFSQQDPDVLEASRYGDVVNFARKINVPIRVTVALVDQICSPGSVYSAYNVIPSADKEILIEPHLGHENGAQYNRAAAWLRDLVKNRPRETASQEER